jgi:hypothetical protein
MVVDSATDINVLGYGWQVIKNSGTYVDLVGFHAASGALTTAEIVSAIAVAQFSDGHFRWIGVHNGAWTGEEENTSLLSKYHASANGLWVDDTHKAHGGSQCISVWLEDGSYDEIALVPYNRLLTFPLETYSVQTIIEGMNEAEVSEFFPDYDQIVWLDRDESVQEMMGDGQVDDPRAQKCLVDGDPQGMELQELYLQGNPFFSSSEDDMDDDSPIEGGLSDEEMVRVLINHTSTHAVSDSSNVQSISYEDELGETIDNNGTTDNFGDSTSFGEMVENSVEKYHPYEELMKHRMGFDFHLNSDESEYGGDIEENDSSSISSASVIGYGRVLASLGGLAGVNFSKATIRATRGRARGLMKKPGLSHEGREKEIDISEGQKASTDNPVGIRAMKRATKYEEMRSKLGWLPVEVIEKTFDHTTQLARRIETREVFRKHLKSRYPELNRRRLRETYATDTFFSSIPALGGATCMQLYVGVTSRFIAVYAMKTESEGAETLADFVRDYGAPYHIRSDNAKMETGHAFTAICRKYNIKQSTTEPHHPQQNPAERQIQDVKRQVNLIMDRVGCPDMLWLLATKYVVYLLNRTATKSLEWKTPIEQAFGDTPDISNLLQFSFWELVYYYTPAKGFPSTKEAIGRFVGIAENIGDFMTYFVLTDTGQVLARSQVRTAGTEGRHNRRADEAVEDLDNDEKPKTDYLDEVDDDMPTDEHETSVADRAAIEGRSQRLHEGQKSAFRHERDERGGTKHPPPVARNERDERWKARKDQISQKGDDRNEGSQGSSGSNFAGDDVTELGINVTERDPNDGVVMSLNDIANVAAPLVPDPEELIGFKYIEEYRGHKLTKEVREYDIDTKEFGLELANGRTETISHADLMDKWISMREEENDMWSFEKIIGHRKEKRKPPQVQVLWSNGEKTWEKIGLIREDDPITLARYAQVHDLLGQEGWRWAKAYAQDPQKMIRMVTNVMVTKTKKRAPKYKFGVNVPKSVRQAQEYDTGNGNTLWSEAIQKEMKQLKDFDTFEVLGEGEKPPEGYTFVPLHWVFDVKFDGRRKSRLVAGGNRTEPLDTDAYAGVVSIDTIRLGFLIGELNGLQAVATDIGNAYLHGFTKEKVYTRAGPEFGAELQGRFVVIRKALYGLRSSSFSWHEVLADSLRNLGWKSSYADSDLWMKDCGTHYEYLATWVDDVLHWGRKPMELIHQLEKIFPLKGTGMPEYYLGGDIEQIEWPSAKSGKTTAISCRTYITQITTKIEKLFETELRHYGSPMDPNYRPEADETELLPELMIPKYQMLVGCANWVVTLGRFDVYYATVTMARYNQAPREGHLAAMLRIFGFLKHYKKWRLIVDATLPDTSDRESNTNTWTDLYPDAKEELPPNMPEPKGEKVQITLYKDADGASDVVTRRSVTGILCLVNSFPVKFYCKRQNTVESSTYGSELVAARIAVDLLVEMRYKLRMLGVPIEERSIMYGDNMSVVLNTTMPSSALKKKHNAIAYHRVREAVAAGIVDFHHIPTEENIADCLTKPLSPLIYSKLVKPYFQRGITKQELRNQGECQDGITNTIEDEVSGMESNIGIAI